MNWKCFVSKFNIAIVLVLLSSSAWAVHPAGFNVGTDWTNSTKDLYTTGSGTFLGGITGEVSGNLIGDVTGDVTGNLTGNVTGNVTGNLLGDVTGDLTGDVTGGVVLGTNLISYVNTIADLRALTPGELGTYVQVLGYRTVGDGGGGPLRKLITGAAPGTYVDNGGSIIIPTGGNGSVGYVYNNPNSPIIVEEFGAYGDDTHDDFTVFLNALSTGKTVHGEGGKTYLWSSGVTYAPVDYQGLTCDGHEACTIDCTDEGLYLYGNSADFASYNFVSNVNFQYSGTPDSWTFASAAITIALGGDLGYITKAGTTLVDGDVVTITGGNSEILGVSRGRAYYVDMTGDNIHLYSLYDSEGFDYATTISGIGSGTYTLTKTTTGIVFNGIRHYTTTNVNIFDFPLNARFTREAKGDALGDSGGHYGTHINFNSFRGTCGLLNTHEANQQVFIAGVFMGNVFHMNSSGSVNSFNGTSFEGANGVDELGVLGSTVAFNGVRFERSGVGGRWAAEENVDNSMLFSFNGVIWGGGTRPTSWGEAAVITADTNASELTLRGLYPSVVRTSASNASFTSAVAGETYARNIISAAGTITHGDGTIAAANIVMAPGGAVYVEQTPTYSATMAFDLSLGLKIRVNGISGALTVNKPTNIVGSPEILVELVSNDVAGAKVVTFSSDFRTVLSSNQLSINTSNRTVIHFAYNPALGKFVQSTAPVENLP